MKKSIFQSRHYKAIAKILKEIHTYKDMEDAFIDAFLLDNPHFDRERFLREIRSCS